MSIMHNQYKLALATDLDGTFLEGDYQSKNFFYNEILRLREEVLLIYVTGRPIYSVNEFCVNGCLPTPHYVIGDHGTHVVDGTHFQPVEQLQNPIVEKWNDSNSLLKELLREEVGIQLQPFDSPYRVAYYYDPKQIQDETIHKIAQAGFDVIQSCDMYLDIVPKGVSKGSSLLKLLDHLNVPKEIAVTSGDSLNDLSLFQTGLKSIAVSNSEPKLVAEINNLDNVYRSEFPGLLGIIDGLKFYKKFQMFQNSQR